MTTRLLYGSLAITGSALLAVIGAASFGDEQVEENPSRIEDQKVFVDTSALHHDTAHAPTTSAPLPEACDLSTGQQLGFAISGQDEVALRPEVMDAAGRLLQGKPYTVRQSIQGKLAIEVIEATDGDAILKGRFYQVDASHVHEDRRLESPFLIRVGEDCQIKAFAYHKESKLGYARIQQALLQDLSWKLPTGGQQEHGSDRNGTGEYMATYTILEEGDKPVAHRHIQRYDAWPHVAPDGDAVQVEYSALDIEGAARSGWFEVASLKETISSKAWTTTRELEARKMAFDETALHDVSASESDYVWADLLPVAHMVREHAPFTESELHAMQMMRNMPMEDVVKQYVARVEDQNIGVQDTWPPLKTYLEARPEMAEEFVDKLRHQELPAEATMGVYIALGNARTDESRKALVGILENPSAPVFERTRAMLNLVNRPDLEPNVAEYLDQHAAYIASGEDRGTRILARHAMLAFGVMSGMRPEDAYLKEKVKSRITTLLAELEHPLHLRPVYGAIANVGDPSFLSLVQDLPNHPDKRARKYGAIVVRRMPLEASEAFTRQWLEKEPSNIVRREIYRVLELQSYDADQNVSPAILKLAMRDLQRDEPGPITRKSIIRLLGRANKDLRDEMPEIERLLLEQMDREIEARSGLYSVIAEYIDPVVLRRHMLDEHIDPALIEEQSKPPAEQERDPGQFITVNPQGGGVQ